MKQRWRILGLASAALAAGLVAGGGGSFALWGGGDAIVDTVITSGDLQISADDVVWTEASEDVDGAPHQIAPDEFMARPGDTFKVKFPFDTTLEGDNMIAELNVSWNSPHEPRLADGVTGTYVVVDDDGNEVTDSEDLGDPVTLDDDALTTGGEEFTVLVTLEFAADMDDRFGSGSGTQVADLGKFDVSLEQQAVSDSNG